ncbi:hypothetical protein TWF730_008980 [Orbilia blumenaviensis]|uniref:Uncharacterized protein n=1 Tax=Orbilia blumenaviensis TaxID=1796055 RepID=A0AAV9UYE9_9PEZI
MSTPSDSIRLRQKLSLSESLSGVKSTRSTRSQPPLSKRPSLANSASSMTGSQRNRLREHRAEAVFDQTTPYSTIRLIMTRASEAPNAPVAPHLFKQLMEYFGTDDEQMMTIIENQQRKPSTSTAGGSGIQQENNNPATPAATSSGTPLTAAALLHPQFHRSFSGTGASTPGSEAPIGDLTTRQLSNSEIMLYINTMLGNVPHRASEGITYLEELFGTKLVEGMDEGSEYGYVSDCEPCDIDSVEGDDSGKDRNNGSSGYTGGGCGSGVDGDGNGGSGGVDTGIREGVEKLRVSGGMRYIKEDNNYDAV